MGKRKARDHYYVPLFIDAETAKSWGLRQEDFRWRKLGDTWKRAYLCEVSEEFFYSYMPLVWQQEKQDTRRRQCAYKEQKGHCDHKCKECECPVFNEGSFDVLLEKAEKMALRGEEIPAAPDMMELIAKRELEEALDQLSEEDFELVEMIGQGLSERDIADRLGFKSKTSINRRKKKIFDFLRKNVCPNRVFPSHKGERRGKQ